MSRYMRRRFPQIFLIGILAASSVLALHVHLRAQTQDTVNAVMRNDFTTLASQVKALSDEKLSLRVTVLEDEMGEVKWLARGATAALFGQLALALRRRRAIDVEEEV